MVTYLCCKCDEPVGQSQKLILESGAAVICAKCLELPVLNLFVVVDPLQEGTEEYNNQMASELEGSFLLLGGENG